MQVLGIQIAAEARREQQVEVPGPSVPRSGQIPIIARDLAGNETKQTLTLKPRIPPPSPTKTVTPPVSQPTPEAKPVVAEPYVEPEEKPRKPDPAPAPSTEDPPKAPDNPGPISKEQAAAMTARASMEQARDACRGLAESDLLRRAREVKATANERFKEKRYVQARASYEKAQAYYETAEIVGGE
ncbi:MAG: hypothetical protein ACYS22_03630 [Planctomycetota bacterium]